MPPGEKNLYKSNFWRDFIDLNVAMWQSNNALTPDSEKESDGLTSSPYQWPVLWTGLRMCGWGDDSIKFFLLGTPFIWWGALASVVLLVFAFLVFLIRARRGILDFKTRGMMKALFGHA